MKKLKIAFLKSFGPETVMALGNLYVIFVKLKRSFHFLELLDNFFK